MKAQYYRHLPTAVEALLFTGNNHLEAGTFLGWKDPQEGIPNSGIVVDQRCGVHALPGDYILRDLNGKLSVKPTAEFIAEYRTVDPTEALPGVLLEDYIANPDIIWYGPHPCPTCGEQIIRADAEHGGVKLEAPHEHHYPHHIYEKHECRTVLGGLHQPPTSTAPIPDYASDAALQEAGKTLPKDQAVS